MDVISEHCLNNDISIVQFLLARKTVYNEKNKRKFHLDVFTVRIRFFDKILSLVQMLASNQ